MSQTEVVTVRLSTALKEKLDALAQSTRRSKSFLAAQAIAQFIEEQSWQVQAIETAVALADSPDAQWVDGEQVEDWLASWGTPDEQPAP